MYNHCNGAQSEKRDLFNTKSEPVELKVQLSNINRKLYYVNCAAHSWWMRAPFYTAFKSIPSVFSVKTS